jgi:biotin operon repressor
MNPIRNCRTNTIYKNRDEESGTLTEDMNTYKSLQKNFRSGLKYRTLTDNEKAVLDALVEKAEPLSGKQLSKLCKMDESTIRTHVIPSLRKRNYPIKNRKTVGYYLDWDNSAQ